MDILISIVFRLFSYVIKYAINLFSDLSWLISILPIISTTEHAYEIFGILSSILTAFLGLFAIFLIFKANSNRSEKESIYNVYATEIPRNKTFLSVIRDVYGAGPNAALDHEIYKRMLIRLEVSENDHKTKTKQNYDTPPRHSGFFYINRIGELGLPYIRRALASDISNGVESLDQLSAALEELVDRDIVHNHIISFLVYSDRYGETSTGLNKELLYDLSTFAERGYDDIFENTRTSLIELYNYVNVIDNPVFHFMNYESYRMRIDGILYRLNNIDKIYSSIHTLEEVLANSTSSQIFPEISDPEEQEEIDEAYTTIMTCINTIKDIENTSFGIYNLIGNLRSILSKFYDFDAAYSKFTSNARRLIGLLEYEKYRFWYFALPFSSLALAVLLSFLFIISIGSLNDLGVLNFTAWAVITFSAISLLYPLCIIVRFISD